MESKTNLIGDKFSFAFIIIPTVFLIVGYLINPGSRPTEGVQIFIYILLLLALVFLGAGFFTNKSTIGKQLKSIGWLSFTFYWATQPANLYISEGGDYFNAGACIAGVYVLGYIAYHEWLSIKTKKDVSCLNWIAGAAFIAGILYFGIYVTPIELWFRQVVALHSAWFLGLVTGETAVVGGADNLLIIYKEASIYLIFACTGVQAMVMFVGMIAPLPKVSINRKIIGICITVIPVYILNFMRNSLVTFLTGNNITSFNVAHNIIAKAGALLVLIVLLLAVIKIIPEIMDEILCLTNLIKRKGPLEQSFGKIWRKK